MNIIWVFYVQKAAAGTGYNVYNVRPLSYNLAQILRLHIPHKPTCCYHYLVQDCSTLVLEIYHYLFFSYP